MAGKNQVRANQESFYAWRPHPRYGLDTGPNPPGMVQAYIEITPYDLVKYDVDKTTGYLRVDRSINRAEIVLAARVVGGLQTIDGGKADDKIVAVLENDNFWGDVSDISGLPERLIERLEHYFATYKLVPGEKGLVSIEEVYGSERAREVVVAAIEDYQEAYVGQAR